MSLENEKSTFCFFNLINVGFCASQSSRKYAGRLASDCVYSVKRTDLFSVRFVVSTVKHPANKANFFLAKSCNCCAL